MKYKIKVNISEDDYKSFCFDNLFENKLVLIFSVCVVLLGLILSIVDFILTKKISIYMYIFLFIIIFIAFFMIILSRELGKKIIALYISQQKAVVIPRHCFDSSEEEKEIEEFLKQKYVKKDNQ